MKRYSSAGTGMATLQVLSGLYTLRFAIGAARTELQHVQAAWKVIQLRASHHMDKH